MKRLAPFVVAVVTVGAIVASVWYGFRLRRDSAEDAAATAQSPTVGAPAAGIARGDVQVDPRRQQLTGIRTVAVRRGAMDHTIRTTGTVRAAENRTTDVNVRVDGWIRELFVGATGQSVTTGQRLFNLYSPELRASASEYVLAMKSRDALHDSVLPEARARADALVTSARARLALLDVPATTLSTLDTAQTVPETIEFASPAAGVVVEKTAVAGMHVSAGQSLFKIANLDVIWVEADVRESDLAAVHTGQRATVSIDAYPSQPLSGRVVYVYPYLEEATRTNRVRVELPNAGQRLRPGMFATVELFTPSTTALIVPVDAVLDSGTEQLVFVASAEGHFEPRHVKVGLRSGGDIQILDGLKPDEVVASAAAFFLDSESQLRASLPSFVSTAPGTVPAASFAQLSISLRTDPDPARTGENQFEVTVADATGAPVADADVAIQLFMPAMPTMNMPAMRNEIALNAAGAGRYQGSGQVMMAGRWEATVTVTRAGQRLGAKQMPLIAR